MTSTLEKTIAGRRELARNCHAVAVSEERRGRTSTARTDVCSTRAPIRARPSARSAPKPAATQLVASCARAQRAPRIPRPVVVLWSLLAGFRLNYLHRVIRACPRGVAVPHQRHVLT